ncbi:3755_t:CDS:2, partial [Funneliformis geosporum]
MLLNGFSLEVLVDEMPLAEYTLPDSITNVTMTGKSYTLQENLDQPCFSDFNTYIVAEPGRKFKLRYFSTKATSNNPIMAETLIDGQFDNTYRGLKSRTIQIQDCFMNVTRDKKLEFMFSNSIYNDSLKTTIKTPNSRGGVGIISIYFYKSRSVSRRNSITTTSDIQQVKMTENKKSFEIECTTAFVPQQSIRKYVGYYDMVKASTTPIAALHLHYRPESWFAIRNVQVQIPTRYSLPNITFNSEKVANQMKLNKSIKGEIKNEHGRDKIKQIGTVKIEKENNKRPFDEVNKEEIDVIDLTNDNVVVGAEIVEKRARVMDCQILAMWPIPQSWSKGSETLRVFPSLNINCANIETSEELTQQIFEGAKNRVKEFLVDENYVSPNVHFETPENSVTLHSLTIEVTGDKSSKLDFGIDESYELMIPYEKDKPLIAHLKAPTIFGILHGLNTFTQLIYFNKEKKDLFLPFAPHYISDYPKFSHRGLLLDTARNYYPVNDLLKMLDVMSWNKFNVFHWHIVDANSWPVKSEVYPEL